MVAAIENGTVIDHIPSNRLFEVIRLLRIEELEFSESEIADASTDCVTVINLIVAHEGEEINVGNNIAEPWGDGDCGTGLALHPYILGGIPELGIDVGR